MGVGACVLVFAHLSFAQVSLFQIFHDNEDFLSALVLSLEPHFVVPDTEVVRAGDVGREMFLVSRGELRVIDSAGVHRAETCKGKGCAKRRGESQTPAKTGPISCQAVHSVGPY